MGVWYATREQVMASTQNSYSTSAAALVDNKLEWASRIVEEFLHRRFYPERKTMRFDWPHMNGGPTWEIDLAMFCPDYLISVDSITAGGTAITDYLLRRWDDRSEPPYQIIQVDLSGTDAFQSGDTFQQSIAVTGLWGDKDTAIGIAHGSLGSNINSSVTSVTLNPASSLYATIGVGSLILMDTERMIVRERRMADTGVNTAGTLTDRQAGSSLAVSDASGFAIGETILVDSERMRIEDIAGSNLIVRRAFDSTVLADHASGVDVYALRSCTVERGVLGTTAASHTAGASVYAHQYGIVTELCIAETVVALEQNAAGYARTSGSGDSERETPGRGLESARQAAYRAVGRKQRSRAV